MKGKIVKQKNKKNLQEDFTMKSFEVRKAAIHGLYVCIIKSIEEAKLLGKKYLYT